MAEENAKRRAKKSSAEEPKVEPKEETKVEKTNPTEAAIEPITDPEDLIKKKAAAAAKAKAAALAKQKRMAEGENEEADDLAKKKAAAAAKAKAAALAKQKRMAEGEEAGTDDLAKKKAAAAAKAKAAALAKQKRMAEGGEAGAEDLAKRKAAAAAKAKAAALAKQNRDTDPDKEKAKAIAAAKAKAAAAAKLKGAAGKEPKESSEEAAPSPNQSLLNSYTAIIKEELGADSLVDAYINRLSKDVPTLVVNRETYLEVVTCLRNHPKLQFNFLSEIHGTDFLEHFEVYLYLQSLSFKRDVVVKVKIDREQPEIESVTPLWPGANWAESEAYDLLGIYFTGHPDLKRILLGEEWEGYPLRKDYVQYDDVEV